MGDNTGKLSVVTGASGHVGYALVKELESRGERFRIVIRKDSPIFDGIDCERFYADVTEPDKLAEAFSGADVVYHLAGLIEVNFGNEELLWKVNFDGTKNVARACADAGVRRLVYASSVDAMQPMPGSKRMSEISHYNPDTLEGVYAKTKASATRWLLGNAASELEVIVTLPGACIGPYDFKESNVGTMVRMFMKGLFPVSLSFGAYSFVDVRDVAKGMYAAAQRGRPGESYILTGETVTADELIHILADKRGKRAPRVKIPYWMMNVASPLMETYYKASKTTPLVTRYSLRKLCSNCNFSIDKARRELGYEPMSVRQSFYDMVDWISENDEKKKNGEKKSDGDKPDNDEKKEEKL